VRTVRKARLAVFLRKSKILVKTAKQCIADEPPFGTNPFLFNMLMIFSYALH
jgi:hypothetical protein